MTRGFENKIFPIGAFPDSETANILAQPQYGEQVTLDALMQDWRQKSAIFQTLPAPNLNASAQDLLPLNVSQPVLSKIQQSLASFRNQFPHDYDLAFVPIDLLVTPQRSVLLERARSFAPNASQPLTDDEVAEMCLGRQPKSNAIQEKFLGIGTNPQNPNQIVYVYQFASEDQDIRWLLPATMERLPKINWAAKGARSRLNLRTIPFSVGPGASQVQVWKVPLGFAFAQDQQGQQVQTPIYRLIVHNGIHRIFRLAELGNRHVAALIRAVPPNEIPPQMVDTSRDALLSPRPLMMTDLTNPAISRSFKWRRSKLAIRLRITVDQDRTLIE
jgi:hypothetical protein